MLTLLENMKFTALYDIFGYMFVYCTCCYIFLAFFLSLVCPFFCHMDRCVWIKHDDDDITHVTFYHAATLPWKIKHSIFA